MNDFTFLGFIAFLSGNNRKTTSKPEGEVEVEVEDEDEDEGLGIACLAEVKPPTKVACRFA